MQPTLVCFGALVTTLALPLSGQTENTLPDTPAGRRLGELITVLNSGSYDSIRAYAAANLSEAFVAGALDQRVDALMRMHAESQELTLVRVVNASGDRVVAEVDNGLTGVPEVLGVSVERGRAPRITMWFRGPAYLYDPPAGVRQHDTGEIIEAMDVLLDRLGDAGVFSGVVLIGQGDSVLLRRAVGMASRSPDLPNAPETRFNIASVGKLFTTVAIAQLAEEGLLSFTDPIGRYLGPDWVAPNVASEVRIEHLLTHQSGFGDFLESEAMLRASAPPRSLEDYKPVIHDERPQFRPGARYQYSNSGFILLGAIVERVTGRTFDEYLGERVFGPAGIVGHGDPPGTPMAPPAPTFATGYTSHYSADGRFWTANTERISKTSPSPAGGQYASVDDLWHFAEALQGGLLVRDSTWQALITPLPVRGRPPTGYGFEVTDRGSERVVGHGGSHEGIGAVLDIYLPDGYTLVVLSNSDRSAFALRQAFASLMFR